MAKRNVITIDEEKCTGCGQCVNACVGGALALVNGKAKLMREDYCDGLGVCIGQCAAGALKVEQREVVEYTGPTQHHGAHVPVATAPAEHACPGMANRLFPPRPMVSGDGRDIPSALGHWPLQLHLIRPDAPHYCGADVLIAASCTAFACGAFHPKLLNGKSLIIACPKLDNPTGYIEKLSELLRVAQPKSLTVARMEVPCCQGLVSMVLEAAGHVETDVPMAEVVIGLQGDLLAKRDLASVRL
jgi:NAD-dependent dihydropyrimidine dehydrogenase PreA subunit